MATEPERGPAPSGEQVRAQLLRFAQLIQRLDRDGQLLKGTPVILGRLGDLRQMLFDYEVRVTERLLPIEDPAERRSRDVVRQAREAEEDLLEEWKRGWQPEEPGEPE
ncbi:MAG: hypothetical protein ACE5JR_03490 [Gemmatimonadota bacterium]